jgi:hypothetical protein
MRELFKTILMVGISVWLVVTAVTTAPPPRAAPDALFDVGEPFFPAFTGADAATTLQVVQWDDQTGAALPFAVTNRGGLWTIPSHHDYPADGRERLATAAAEVITLVKDEFRSDNIADHVRLGVVDPLDQTATSLEGRGTRLTFRGNNDEVLADVIVGDEILERPGFRFVRVPDQKRVYTARFDAEISTAFEDWIDTNLLEVERAQVTHVVLKEYFLNEETRQVVRRGEFILDKVAQDEWLANRVPEGMEVDFVQANLLVGAIIDLKIAGVRPKPAGMVGNLREAATAGRITQADVSVLTSRGFYPTPEGELLSNEGELIVRTTEGVRYTLRFGEVVYGQGDAVVRGDETSDDQDVGLGENRYVFITAEFDQDALPEPPAADADQHASWERRVREGREKADRLATRFANWYYVVAADSYERMHKPSEEFVREIQDGTLEFGPDHEPGLEPTSELDPELNLEPGSC